MDELLTVEGLTKRYETFALDDVSFTLPAGYIMGFIGRNGAGKTTTIKSMLNLVHRDAGRVTILGRDLDTHELRIKQDIGLTLGGVTYYPTTRLARITSVFHRFYETWDDKAYRAYLSRFELDETKKVGQLSAGMKVKYALALALSHHARLLILDEPTSGLDPISRDDLLDLFREIIEEGERSILFSTQITSDLDKCADYITYIREGRLVASAPADEFIGSYRLVSGRKDQLTPAVADALIGSDASAIVGDCEISRPDIEQIMIYCERAGRAPAGGKEVSK